MVFQTQMPNRVPFFNAALYSAPPGQHPILVPLMLFMVVLLTFAMMCADIRKLGTVEDVSSSPYVAMLTLCLSALLEALFTFPLAADTLAMPR